MKDSNREAFENWHIRNMDINSDFEKIGEQDSPYMDEHVNDSWLAWQAAKAQAVPEGYKIVPVNYECVWCGCTELDGWTDEPIIEAQEPTND